MHGREIVVQCGRPTAGFYSLWNPSLVLRLLIKPPVGFTSTRQRRREPRITLQRGMKERGGGLQTVCVLIVLQVANATNVVLIGIRTRHRIGGRRVDLG